MRGNHYSLFECVCRRSVIVSVSLILCAAANGKGSFFLVFADVRDVI